MNNGIKRDVIVIGASAGGVEALMKLCAELPSDLPAIVGVVIHRSPWFRSDIASLYGLRAKIRVREGQPGEKLEMGTVYFAPADHHMLFTSTHIELMRGPKVHFTRPAVDCLFLSASDAFKKRVAGILLTGGGTDGGHGLRKIKAYGGLTFVQKPEEASNPMMPLTGIREDHPDGTVSLERLPALMVALATGNALNTDEPGAHYHLMGSRWV
jgi:two-component system chemotaxis response regulator CheB